MCRVCLSEVDGTVDLCEAHDGKRPSTRVVWRYVPRTAGGPLARLRDRRCVIEATGSTDAVVRFIDVGSPLRPTRSTVQLRDLERAA